MVRQLPTGPDGVPQALVSSPEWCLTVEMKEARLLSWFPFFFLAHIKFVGGVFLGSRGLLVICCGGTGREVNPNDLLITNVPFFPNWQMCVI